MDELTKAQRFACNLAAGVIVILCGIFLLLAGTGAIGLKILDILAPAILFTIGFILLFTAVIQRNTLSMWLSFVFIVPGMVTAMTVYSHAQYSQLYPIYIAIPAISSLATLPLSDEKKAHLSTIFFFTVIAAVFSLKSSGLTGWSVVIPVLLIFIGLVIVYLAVKPRLFKQREE